jgi:tryptophanyl-tRNA synthetase
MRDAATRFNNRFGDILVVPEQHTPTVGARVRDLQEPTRKMSTTNSSELGTAHVLDSPEDLRRKFKKAQADSGREIVRREDKPGISNLIEIMAAARGIPPEQVEREFEGSGYGDFKTAVGDAVVDWLAPVRERYPELRADEDELERILEEGADRARTITRATLADVRDAMGVGPARRVSVGPAT